MILLAKKHNEPSVFRPENLLREARRQKVIADCKIPAVCVLDPDGDIVDYLIKAGKARRNTCWACYHTTMYEFSHKGQPIGIIGCAVGASFAVLLAEQMFVSGCELLISITSAGIINPPPEPTRFVLITEALRDEGTSYHYLPPEETASLDPELLNQLQPLTNQSALAVTTGSSWTTDAPYRETQTAITSAKEQGVTAVEMEASALYAFAKARQQRVVCFAHLTNTMAQQEGDFEKGETFGSLETLELVSYVLETLQPENIF